jgi:hypothetical protein
MIETPSNEQGEVARVTPRKPDGNVPDGQM